MTLKIGINGFGRIGRCVLRAARERGLDVEFTAINDLSDVDNLAYLLRRDSVHGRFDGEVKADGDAILVDGHRIPVSSRRSISDLDWSGTDIVMECTGVFTARDAAAQHLDQGANKVLVSAPGKGVDATVVYGVNNDALEAGHTVVSNGSCTTNALAPVAKVLDDSFGIVGGFMTTVHAYTGGQPVLDAPNSKDWARGRAGALNMVPTTTGAARAISLVLPELEGKLDGAAVRVPVADVSVVDLKVRVERTTTVEEVNAAFAEAASGPMKGVLQVVSDPLVSSDLIGDPHSSSQVPGETAVVGGDFVRVLSWYDNEWGFSNRMLDVAMLMHGKT